MKCKYCESENLYLEPKVEGENPMTADMVALKCKDCKKWLKWVRKEDRYKYISHNTDEIKPEIQQEKSVDTFASSLNNRSFVVADTSLAYQMLLDLRKEISNYTVLYRATVLGLIDNKIQELHEMNKTKASK